MKKIAIYILSVSLILVSLIISNISFGQFDLGNTDTILNTDINSTINIDLGDGEDPLRGGAYHIVNSSGSGLKGIVDSDTEITKHKTALNRTLGIIRNIVNRALGLVALVALVYIIVHGFIMMTASGDETKFKKGIKGIKNAAIAMLGIGLSWFIISMIFWIITKASQ